MNLEYEQRNWKFPHLKFKKNPTSMKKQKIETKYMNLGWFSMWLVANQVSVLISLVVNVQHSVEVGVGVWPCQPSSKWWRLWGVLWDFGATQESLSQELGQGRTCSTFPNSLSLCSLERAGASTPLFKSQLANAFGEGVGGAWNQVSKVYMSWDEKIRLL